jgi:hypothetical protein
MKAVLLRGGAALIGLVALLHCTGPEETGAADGPIFAPALSASREEVRGFLSKAMGGPKAKLVYVDRLGKEPSLKFIDFDGAGTPEIKTIALAENPAVPVISPDGRWVVYGSGNGCETGSPATLSCSVYLVELKEDGIPLKLASDSACEPRFAQGSPLTVVYTTSASNLGWEGHGRTLKIVLDPGTSPPTAGKPEVLVEHGSYTGGLSWDGRYLGGGGEHVAMLDLQGGKSRPDTLSYQGIQSCNASVSSSRLASGALMYLNTSGSHPALNGGKTWGEWQAILISDSQKRLLRGYMHPASFTHPLETSPASLSGSKWHHSEWSNHPHFAAATVNVERFFKTDAGYANTAFQERIHIINLRDSTYLEVLRPDTVAYKGKVLGGFFWPWLWVEVPAGFEEAAGWLKPLP